MGNALEDGLCVACNIVPVIERPDNKFQLPMCAVCKEKMAKRIAMIKNSGKSKHKKVKISSGFLPDNPKVPV